MIAGALALAVAALLGLAPLRRPRVRAGASGAARVADRRLARGRSLRGGRGRLDGADARLARRGHGPRRHALVPHAARGAVRRRGALRHDRLLRPDLLRLVLPLELRGRARGPAARLRPRHPLAADQPRLAGARPDGRLRDRPALRGRAAEPDRRRDRPRGPEPGRVPGRRGAQRHRRRLAGPLHGRGARQRPGRGPRPRSGGWHPARAARGGGPRRRPGGGHEALLPGPGDRAVDRVDRDRGRRSAAADGALVRAAGVPRRRLLVRPQRGRDRQPDPLHPVRAARAAGPGAGLRAAPGILGLPLRDRLRRLVGLVLPRPRRLVRLPLAAGPGGGRRRRRSTRCGAGATRCCGCSARSSCSPRSPTCSRR